MFINFFSKRKKERKRQTGRNIDVREKHRSVVYCTCPNRGSKSTTYVMCPE